MHRRHRRWRWRWQATRVTWAPSWGSLWSSWPIRLLTGWVTYASWWSPLVSHWFIQNSYRHVRYISHLFYIWLFSPQVLIPWQSMWLPLTAASTASSWTLRGGRCSAGQNGPPQVGRRALVSVCRASLHFLCAASLKGKEMGWEHRSGADKLEKKTATSCFEILALFLFL